VVARYQRAQLAALLTTNEKRYRNKSAAALAARANQSARAASRSLVSISIGLTQNALMLFALAVVMIYQDMIMSIIIVLVAPIAAVGMSILMQRIRSMGDEEFEQASGVVGVTSEILRGADIVKAFQLENKMAERAEVAIGRLERRTTTVNRYVALGAPLAEVLGGILIAFFVLYIAWRTNAHGATPGQFMSFIIAFLLAYQPAVRLMDMRLQLSKSLRPVERMFQLIDSASTKTKQKGSRVDIPECPTLVFDNVVCKRGHQRSSVLNGASFTIKGGKQTALIGRSGAGKSTVAELILGFIDRYSGSITIEGRELSEIDDGCLLKAISYVAQETFLFNGTIADNIRMGDLNATDNEVLEAAQTAQLHDLSGNQGKSLDMDALGYVITDGEEGLSGGQRQRVAIARAVLKKSPILILDEATSALDVKTEKALVNLNRNSSFKRTILTISHRVPVAQASDHVVLLEDGQCKAEGDFETVNALFVMPSTE
ncbi:MAG: ABC transporter ATP-binding protein, partial [Pseudomonadota bacterium]